MAILHFIPLPGQVGSHFLHRELFFFPLILAAFWFGLKGGLFSAAAISVIYVLYFAVHRGHQPDLATVVALQVVVFFAVAGILGGLVDRNERRRNERDYIKDTFGKYFPEELRDEILQGRIPTAGEIKEATLLFADLRDFTAIVERTAPRIVVQVINSYFEAMAEAIRNNGGLILQFIGDEIEAVFGAPLPAAQHADLAVLAALEMRKRLSSLNEELQNKGIEPLRHGIGIHSGKVLAGNIGCPELLSYAMVGKTVNLASRIQELNKPLGSDILISSDTQKMLTTNVSLLKEPPIQVKGIEKPVEVFRIC